MKIIQSTCNYCAIACNLDFYVEDDKIVKIHPTENHPINNGSCCIKGLNLDKQTSKYKTEKSPLLRGKDGKFKSIEWDEAFKLMSEKIKENQNKYGKESFAYLSTGQLTTEKMALLGHIGRNFLGGNGDGNTRLCMASAVVAYKQSFGFDAPPYALKDIELSDTIILIGSNPVLAHPIIWEKIENNKKAKLIVVDPRKSESAKNADLWIDIKPKGDLVLFYTLANVLIEKNWIDKHYIDNFTEDYESFKEFVKKFSLDKVEEKTGISPERVLELAEIIYKGKKVSFWWTMGVNQSYQAVRTAQAIINLALITGNIGKPGTGANSLTGQCNAMGSRLFSNTTCLYGGGAYNNLEERKRISNILGIEEDMLPSKPTLAYDEIIGKINSGEIKVLWVVSTNPRHSWSNNKTFEEAIKKLDLFIVQDLYKDTDSAKICDLYLPAVPALKDEGFFINTERRLTGVQPVLSKKEYEKTDYEIFLGVGQALGMGKLLEKWKTPRDAFELLKKCSEGQPCDITGVEYDDLKNSKGIQWPLKKGEKLTSDERRLFADNKFYRENGKAKFIFEDILENPVHETKEFPYVLNTGRATVGQWHTQTRTREIPAVSIITPKKAYIYINIEDAKKLNIKSGEEVTVKSINGEKSTFTARLTDDIKPGNFYSSHHYIETNNLTPSVFDNYSREPSYKTVAVRIEK
ncbi:molybdopterin oxidoreductase family protein [Clostridium thermobutyricum]